MAAISKSIFVQNPVKEAKNPKVEENLSSLGSGEKMKNSVESILDYLKTFLLIQFPLSYFVAFK